ncbi:hypothetical protein PJ15_1483 [Acinetobacter sp. neg1]|uniref:hypothetical protein n=1 Tax=Acinetobacter sp. neg1 TaxID=1561068 RepID=UPI0005421A37|nr:hypothetical protein [Acinetobacter sp. neg1]KHF78424.1 hypothetical protein PJ15_1483 [Acinetobacter sp. neg1]
MAKKALNEKIKIIGFWTFCGIFWYLVIAFFFKSEYPLFNYKFNPKDAYDVLKDALTLAAAFLAPVAAFILFSDWRESHVEIRNENIGLELYHFIIKTNNDLDRIDIKFRFKSSKIERPEDVLQKAYDIKLLILEKGMIASSLDSDNSTNELREFAKLTHLLIMDMWMFVNYLINLASLKVQLQNIDNAENEGELLNLYTVHFDIYKKKSVSRMQNYEELHTELISKLDAIKVQN